MPALLCGQARGRRESPATSLTTSDPKGFLFQGPAGKQLFSGLTGKTASLTLILAAGAARKRLGHPYGRRNPTVAVRARGFSHARAPLRASPREAGIRKRHLAVSFAMVGLNRLELSTSRLSGVCSNQLSYNPSGTPCGCGGDARIRTEDLLNANQALYQLSYTPK